MTLFLTSGTTRYEIHDVYVGAVGLIIGLIVGRIARNVIIRLCEKRKLNPNDATLVRGGDSELILTMSNQQDENVEFTLLDEHDSRSGDFITEGELANAILVCIKNDKSYFIKNTQLRQLLFILVKAKLKKTSIILSPQLVRFLAYKILMRNPTLREKARNFLLSKLDSVRTMIWYTFLSLSVTSDLAKNIYQCDNFFGDIPVEGRTMNLISSSKTGHLVITDLDEEKDTINLMLPEKEQKSFFSIRPRIHMPDFVIFEKNIQQNSESELAIQKPPVCDNVPVKELSMPKVHSRRYVKAKKPFKTMTLNELQSIDPILKALKLEKPEGTDDLILTDDVFQKQTLPERVQDGIDHMFQ